MTTSVEQLPPGATGLVAGRPGPSLADVGYTEAEYVVRGVAPAYRPTGPSRLPADGRWALAETDPAPFATRIVVRRPAAAGEGSGTVVAEWLNVSSGADAAPDWTYLAEEVVRRGHVWLGVSAQHAGVMGGRAAVPVGGLRLPALRESPRYAALDHPGDAYSYGMFTAAVSAALAGPLGDLAVDCRLAVGESQSAYALTSYVNGVHPLTRAFDGYLVHSRGGAAMPLGEPGCGIDLATTRSGAPTRIRDDLDVPVIVVQTETDLLGRLWYLPARQPDAERLRVWEVAGTAHADKYQIGDFEVLLGCPEPVNRGQQAYVVRAALRRLEQWARGGVAAPSAPPLAVSEGGFAADEVGNARGGVRTPAVEAPVEMLSGLPAPGAPVICQLFGRTRPLPGGVLAKRYGSVTDYLAAYQTAVEAAVAAGFLLREDCDEMLAEARPELVAAAVG